MILVTVSDVVIQHRARSCWDVSQEILFSASNRTYKGLSGGRVRGDSVCQQELVQFIFPPLSFNLGYLSVLSKVQFVVQLHHWLGAKEESNSSDTNWGALSDLRLNGYP